MIWTTAWRQADSTDDRVLTSALKTEQLLTYQMTWSFDRNSATVSSTSACVDPGLSLHGQSAFEVYLYTYSTKVQGR